MGKIKIYDKLFGSGPVGVLLSLVLLSAAHQLNRRIHLPPVTNNRFLPSLAFFVSILITAVIIVWSVKSLPVADRGNKLCTTGAFKYVRHPLYAAFLSVFNFGLAVYLNSYLYLLWAVLLHPLWHLLIRSEERMLVDLFGEGYIEYQKKTGRFFPRLFRRGTG